MKLKLKASISIFLTSVILLSGSFCYGESFNVSEHAGESSYDPETGITTYIDSGGAEVLSGLPVSPSAWAVDEVNEAISKGLVPSELQKDYQKNITRKELAYIMAYYLLSYEPSGTTLDEMWESLLNKYKELTEFKEWDPLLNKYKEVNKYTEYRENVFSDTNDEVLNWLYALGFIKGFEDGSFKPDNDITREEAAAIFYRGFKPISTNGAYSMQGVWHTTDMKFKDFPSDVSPWAAEAVEILTFFDCMKGMRDDMFVPRENITREQAIVIALRMTKNGEFQFRY